MSIRFGCESCGRHLEAEDSMIGQRIYCPHCGHRELVPPRSTIGPHRPDLPADIEFRCAACDQGLVVAASAVGLRVDCPKCRQALVVPDRSGVRVTPSPSPPSSPQPGRSDGPRAAQLREPPPHGPAPPTAGREPTGAALRVHPSGAPAVVTDPAAQRRRALGRRYSALRAFSVLYKCAAVVVMLAAAAAGLFAVLQNRWEGVVGFALGFGFALVLASIGQVIDLFLDLELNTRATCVLLEDYLRERRAPGPAKHLT